MVPPVASTLLRSWRALLGSRSGCASHPDYGIAQLYETAVLAPALEVQGKLAPPVRVLNRGARQIDLVGLSQNVLELDHKHLAWRTRQITLNCTHELWGHGGRGAWIERKVGRQQPFA